MHRFENLTYANMHKMNHNGVGHKNGQNIVWHIVSMLDGDSHYIEKNGKVHVRDLHIENGKIKRRKKYITLENHNKISYPQINGNLNNI